MGREQALTRYRRALEHVAHVLAPLYTRLEGALGAVAQRRDSSAGLFKRVQ
jgi:hypothetical protein